MAERILATSGRIFICYRREDTGSAAAYSTSLPPQACVDDGDEDD
jgi:hypothetical protein